MSQPFIPTGREYDDGDLPDAPKKEPAKPAAQESPSRGRAIHGFALTVAPEVDERRGGAGA